MLPRANAYAMIRRRAAGAQARQQQLPGDRDHRLPLCETQMPKPLTSVSAKRLVQEWGAKTSPGPRHWPVNDRRALDDDYRLSVLWQTATPVWQAANDIPTWIWRPHVERIFMAVDDLGCHDLLA